MEEATEAASTNPVCCWDRPIGSMRVYREFLSSEPAEPPLSPEEEVGGLVGLMVSNLPNHRSLPKKRLAAWWARDRDRTWCRAKSFPKKILLFATLVDPKEVGPMAISAELRAHLEPDLSPPPKGK